jgi:aspartate aminotransferase
VIEELKKNAHQKDYLPVAGLRELREAVSNYHNRVDGRNSTADEVMIGPGSKELLFLAQLCYGAELIIPSPSWVSYGPQASILGLPTTWVDTTVDDGWRLQASDLRQACLSDPSRPRLLILNYPNNPAGTTLSAEHLKAIAEVCREFGILVLSDEIYGEVHHKGEHLSLSSVYPEGTIISNGLSKWCGAGGWRLGTFLFPESLAWLREAMCVVASETYTSVSAPIQWAAVAAYSDRPELQVYLRDSRRVLSKVAHTTHRRLTQAGLRVPSPEGGFYQFPDASPLSERLSERGITDSTTFCERLLQEAGVAVLPGVDFGRPYGELTFRLATVNFDGGDALQAVTSFEGSDESFVREHCTDLWEALKKLSEWLASESVS